MDKYHKIWEPVLRSFKEHHPGLYEDMVDWYPSGYLEITVKLCNGQRISYELMDDLIRIIRNEGDSDQIDIDELEWRLIFAERLRTRMRRCCINQERLSECTGISKVMISRYMNGKASPSGYNLELLGRALRCSVSELVSTR